MKRFSMPDESAVSALTHIISNAVNEAIENKSAAIWSAPVVQINAYSALNPWIDAKIYVINAWKKDALAAVRRASDAYWDESNNCECYGDILEAELENIPHVTYFRNSNENEDDPEFEALPGGCNYLEYPNELIEF